MAAPTVNLGLYQPTSSVGGLTLPNAATPKQQYTNSLATLTTGKNPAGLQTAGITNQQLLPENLRTSSSNGATSPTPTKITPPTSAPRPSGSSAAGQYYGNTIDTNGDIGAQIAAIDKARASGGTGVNSPAGQAFIGSTTNPTGQGRVDDLTTRTGSGTPPPPAPPSLGTGGTSGTPPAGGAPPPTTPTQPAPPSTYDLAMNSYLDSLKSSQDITARVQKETLDANHSYQAAKDASGGYQSGNDASAARRARFDNASLADLGVAETAANNQANLAFQRLNFEKGNLPNNDPYTLSPGDVRFDASGHQIAAVPANPSSAKTIGSPTEGVYEQQADGSFKQVIAPVGGDNVQSLATELVTGNLAPADLSKRSTGVGSYSDILNAANQISQNLYGKPFDIAKANTDYKFANNPQTQNTLNYLGSLVGSADGSTAGNLDQLVTLSGQVAEPKGFLGLGQSNFPALNDATQWARLSSGDPTVAAYYSTLLEVSDQVAKVLQGGGSGGTSDAKLAQAQSLFQKGFTKDQIAAVAGALKPLLANRATSMIKDNPYLSTYAQEFGITQNNNKGTGGSSSSGGSSASGFGWNGN